SEKIGTDAGAVLDLFGDRDGAGADTGIAAKIYDFALGATTGAEALIPVKQKALQDQIANLQKTIDDNEAHANKLGDQLTLKFAKFEQVMGQLKQQQAALLAKFGNSILS
ncbi:MAG TPA: flagellar filament capping protein FliD, partial [Planctomycetota bacterium]|nr:flagellar filament capping protein FliD [Planctomycetota bacterium]